MSIFSCKVIEVSLSFVQTKGNGWKSRQRPETVILKIKKKKKKKKRFKRFKDSNKRKADK